MEEQFVALEKMAEGAIIERFAEEFQRVIENVVDPNTDPTAKRHLEIKVVVIPNEQRNFADVRVSVIHKLAPHTPTLMSFRIGKLGNRVEATEITPQQTTFLPVGVQ